MNSHKTFCIVTKKKVDFSYLTKHKVDQISFWRETEIKLGKFEDLNLKNSYISRWDWTLHFLTNILRYRGKEILKPLKYVVKLQNNASTVSSCDSHIRSLKIKNLLRRCVSTHYVNGNFIIFVCFSQFAKILGKTDVKLIVIFFVFFFQIKHLIKSPDKK